MGFWHTGYIDFHQPDWDFDSSTISTKQVCLECGQVFADVDSLRSHRFQNHRLKVPKLFIRGREIGSSPVNITKAVGKDDVYVENADLIYLNDQLIQPTELCRKLGSIAFETCNIRLEKDSVPAEFKLVISIASEIDLKGVEHAFYNLAKGLNLSAKTIARFITDASGFESAIGYCDGISSYLYGVLAKEGNSEIQTPFENYPNKFNAAADRLMGFDRPLARSIETLIAFHFNQFSTAASVGRNTRVGLAARKYFSWIRGDRQAEDARSEIPGKIDVLITDLDMERIIQWSLTPKHELEASLGEMEALINSSITESGLNHFDIVKLRILLSETYSALGKSHESNAHAKCLRNTSSFENWSESMIIKNSMSQNEQQ